MFNSFFLETTRNKERNYSPESNKLSWKIDSIPRKTLERAFITIIKEQLFGFLKPHQFNVDSHNSSSIYKRSIMSHFFDGSSTYHTKLCLIPFSCVWKIERNLKEWDLPRKFYRTEGDFFFKKRYFISGWAINIEEVGLWQGRKHIFVHIIMTRINVSYENSWHRNVFKMKCRKQWMGERHIIWKFKRRMKIYFIQHCSISHSNVCDWFCMKNGMKAILQVGKLNFTRG